MKKRKQECWSYKLYHCGASLKDLGKKCFAISKIEDMEYIEKISCVEEVKTQ